jgi:hypothetical protein
MPQGNDIIITLPTEHYDALSAVISAGLKHANIKSEVRRELQAWWTVESELIGEFIEDKSDE